MKKEIQLIKYEITPSGKFYKTEVWDEYGTYSCVYERSEIKAMEYILEWWKESEERQRSNDLMNKAIRECIEIDREAGITSRNRDCLD